MKRLQQEDGKALDIYALNEFARQLGRQQLLAEAEQSVELAQAPHYDEEGHARGYHYLCIK